MAACRLFRIAAKSQVKRARTFDAQAFLYSAGIAKTIVEYRRGDTVFSQGDPCEHVIYIQKGCVKLSVRSKAGREAVVAMLGTGDFFGEDCLAGQTVRTRSATAICPSTVLGIEKARMARLLHDQHAMSDRFIAHMLLRNIRIEEDLIRFIEDHGELQINRSLLGVVLRD
jgi:CRP-like cAMP-binding protein